VITRIITVGPQRLGNLLLSLYYDHYLDPAPDLSVIITPLHAVQVTDIIGKLFPTLNFCVYNDSEFIAQYPDIQHWQDQRNLRAGWLQQQALKLAALDSLSSEYFLIQDPDTFCIEPYVYYQHGQLCYFVLPNQFHYTGYYQTLENVLGIPRQTQDSFVTEFMPVSKTTWTSCAERIKQTSGGDWTTLLQHVPLEAFGKHHLLRWFSEYELLGNWQLYLAPLETKIQKRFVFNEIETLNDLNIDYNVVCDRGIQGQVKGTAGLFSDHCTVNFDNINKARQILRSKNLC
jgi:hypothetical protein